MEYWVYSYNGTVLLSTDRKSALAGNELTAGLYHYALIADGALIDTKTMV